ncbi:retrovirus-related Pol polyprotein from transposon 412 [Trichonephila clavipes]|nr:retrovirus-related Pol polyprotein from transposon 412 [Trichonephila clavipes]
MACERKLIESEATTGFFVLLGTKGKKETLEWCMKANLIASRYECPRFKKICVCKNERERLTATNGVAATSRKIIATTLFGVSAVHETTGYSPSQMLFGRDLHLPADLLFSRPPDAPLSPEEYIEKLQARMEEMHHLAIERIGMASEKMKTRYDARATGHDFHEGDKVSLTQESGFPRTIPRKSGNSFGVLWRLGVFSSFFRFNLDLSVLKPKHDN